MDLLARRRMMMRVAEEPVIPIQILPNGDFSNGTTGWAKVNNSTTVENDNNSLLVTIVTASSSKSRGVYIASAKPVPGHVYYNKFHLVTSYKASVRVRTDSQAILTIATTADTEITIDNVREYTGTAGQRINVYSHYGAASTVGQTMRIYTAMCIDLTATFGEGNEPDLNKCRRLFPLDYYDYNTGN